MKKNILIFITSLASIILGLLYTQRVFGPTEAETILWGQIAIGIGILIIISATIAIYKNLKLPKLIVIPEHLGLMLFQFPPIIFWFIFHNAQISDGTPPSWFIAHWIYAVPHILLLIFGSLVLFNVNHQ